MESGGRRRGRGQRLLYWFRTPPGVRVGRAAIDEAAIQLLEHHNPDVQFDWPRLLKEAVPEPAPRRERDGRDRDRDRRDRRDARPPQRPRPMDTTAAAVPPMPSPAAAEDIQALAEAAEQRAAEHAEHVESHAADHVEAATLPPDLEEDVPPEGGSYTAGYVATDDADPTESGTVSGYAAYAEPEPERVDLRDAVEPGDSRTRELENAGTEEPLSGPVADRLGADGLARLRARYREVVVRLTAKPMDESAREELKLQAERLNPDLWLTVDEVTLALEQYETVFESLRSVVGRYPQRRRRRR